MAKCLCVRVAKWMRVNNFLGSYPEVKEIQRKEGNIFTVYEVVISNLDHLVIKFEK